MEVTALGGRRAHGYRFWLEDDISLLFPFLISLSCIILRFPADLACESEDKRNQSACIYLSMGLPFASLRAASSLKSLSLDLIVAKKAFCAPFSARACKPRLNA